MKKIVFGITNLSVGGAERILVDLVNKLSKDEKYDITILTLYAKGEFEKQVTSSVKIENMYSNSYEELTRFQRVKISTKLLLNKKAIYNKYLKGKYDIEIAFLEGPITRLFSTNNENVEKIACVHTDITKIFGKSLKSYIKKKYDSKIYNKYKRIMFVSKDNLEKFKNTYLNIEKEKLQIMHNYIDEQRIIEKSKEKIDIKFINEKINFVTVSRLMKVKALDRLIKVHKRLLDNGLAHNIYVVGDGPERTNLENFIEEQNVKDTFKLIGEKKNPYPYIKNADVFCLFSHYEGLPMVIQEAKVLNKFIIITNTSAREAVENYKRSMIVENNDDDIYKGMKEIIENREKYL